jgi:hypothetical protein
MIDDITQGHNMIDIYPTGSGKSLIFQLLVLQRICVDGAPNSENSLSSVHVCFPFNCIITKTIPNTSFAPSHPPVILYPELIDPDKENTDSPLFSLLRQLLSSDRLGWIFVDECHLVDTWYMACHAVEVGYD